MANSITKLSVAMAAQDAQEVEHIGHNSAGVSVNCGMTSLVAPLLELERMGRENNLTEAASLSGQIAYEFERTKTFLHEKFGRITCADA